MLDISDLNSKNGDSTFKTMDLGMKLIAISNPNLSLSRFWFLPLALGLCNAGDCILHPRKPFCIYIYTNLLHLTGKLHSHKLRMQKNVS